MLSAHAEILWRKRKRRFPLKTNKKTSKQINGLLTPRCASAACVCSPGQPAGSTTAESAKSATQQAEPTAFLPPFPAVARSQSPCLICWTLPFAPTADVKSIASQKTSRGSSPHVLSQPVGSGGCQTPQTAVTLPAPHLSLPTAEHLEPAMVQEQAELGLPSHAECRPLNEEQQQQPLAPGDGLATDCWLRCYSSSQPHARLEL